MLDSIAGELGADEQSIVGQGTVCEQPAQQRPGPSYLIGAGRERPAASPLGLQGKVAGRSRDGLRRRGSRLSAWLAVRDGGNRQSVDPKDGSDESPGTEVAARPDLALQPADGGEADPGLVRQLFLRPARCLPGLPESAVI